MLTVLGQDTAQTGDHPARAGLANSPGDGSPAVAELSGPDKAAPPRAKRFGLKNLRLRSKLAIVLLVPALTTLVLAGLRLNSQLEEVALFNKVQRAFELSSKIAEIGDAVQQERNWIVRYIASNKSSNATEQAARTRKLDTLIANLRQSTAEIDDLDRPVQDALRRALDELGSVTSLRSAAANTNYPDRNALIRYSEVLNVLTQVSRVTASSVNHPNLAPLASGLYALTSAREELTQQNAQMIAALVRKDFQAGQAEALHDAQARFESSRNDFLSVIDSDNRQRFNDTVTGSDVDDRNRLIQLAVVLDADNKPVVLSGLSVDQFEKIGESSAGLISKVMAGINDQLKNRVAALAATARESALRDGALVFAALIIAFGLMLVVARSMLTPLRVLRRTALDVAKNRLPAAIDRILNDKDAARDSVAMVEPVPVHTTEEVGQLARAFDVVHREAIRLASEQALLRENVNDIFANLSRRSQTLVERQLGLIDRLEQDEQDPDHLSSLFELDHLATRMRRNNENLLVLSGSGLGRRLNKPVPAADVIGAAVSEVEQYARVEIVAAPEMLVQGHVVSDLVHLISELLDNATEFSDPQTKVTVRSIKTRRDELAIEIKDRGVGLTEQAVADLNERLANPPDVDVEVARRMGLWVVARLAKRHEIRVRLHSAEDIEGGTTALVIVPAGLVRARTGQLRSQYPTGQLPPATETSAELSYPELKSGAAFGAARPTRLRPELDTPKMPALPAGSGPGTGEHSLPSFPPLPAGHVAEITGQHQLPPLDAEPVPAEVVEPPPPPAPVAAAVEEAPAPKAVDHGAEAMTERLPIYEAVLSQWFQVVDDQVPEPQPGRSAPGLDAPRVPEAPEPVHEPLPAPAPEPAPVVHRAPPPPAPQPAAPQPVMHEPVLPARPVPPAPRPEPEPLAQEPVAPEPVRAAAPPPPVRQETPAPATPPLPRRPERERPEPSRAEQTWRSPADEGWQAAQALLEPKSEGTTQAGLPKRVPKAHLVPGSAAPSSRGAQPAQPSRAPAMAPPAAPPRSADAVRVRLSSYQRAFRRGRHTMADAENGSAPASPENRADEEQE